MEDPITVQPGHRIDIRSVPNLRDLGGYDTADGRIVRRGQLFRSVELNHLAGDDLVAFARLGLRRVFDLRTEAERTAEPDVIPEGVQVIVCDVLRDAGSAAPAQLLGVLGDPRAAQRMLGDGRATAMFIDGYRKIVSLPSARVAYRRFFTEIASDGGRPALFHCTTGKDRTGWAAAATLLLLGVAEGDVFDDYLATNRDLLPALKPIVERFQAAGGDPHLLDPVLGVDRQYLEAALDEMRVRFTSIEGYFSEGLGLDAAAQAALRTALTEPG